MISFAVLIILLNAAALLVVPSYASGKHGPGPIRGALVVPNMIMIALFAPVLIDVGGYVTNCGVFFYAFVVAGQLVILERWGVRAARNTIPATYIRLVMVFASCALLVRLPVVPGNEAFALAARQIALQQTSVIVASFVAFSLSQMALILWYTQTRTRFGWGVAAAGGLMVCQLVDTPIFYLVAFYDNLGWQFVSLGLVGFYVKVGVGFLMLPAVAYAGSFKAPEPEPLSKQRARQIALALQTT